MTTEQHKKFVVKYKKRSPSANDDRFYIDSFIFNKKEHRRYIVFDRKENKLIFDYIYDIDNLGEGEDIDYYDYFHELSKRKK